MTSNESTPAEDIASGNTFTNRRECKDSIRDEGSPARLTEPLAIRPSNMSYPPPVDLRHGPQAIKGSGGEALPTPEDIKLDRDISEQDNKVKQSDAELSGDSSPSDDIDDEQDDKDGYDFDYEDDDISLDEDPFFGVADTQSTSKGPTEEQMEAIRKVMEEDAKAAEKANEEVMNQQAINKILTEDVEPPALLRSDDTYNDPPGSIVPPHPLLKDQNYNAKDMLISIRSSFGGDVYQIVGMNEPLLEMKLKFVQAVNLDLSELNTLGFLCGYHVIQDDDTVEKLRIGPESIIHCQRIEAMRYDPPPLPQSNSTK
ncbi:hypothetical protein QM012_004319 [Aureobasidium pullulans]|uniref:Uncharacterized protein n=1 Tax=Aureobasidium pullulans TaxID=5580 RepID=A0ABR0TUI2_AURPU